MANAFTDRWIKNKKPEDEFVPSTPEWWRGKNVAAPATRPTPSISPSRSIMDIVRQPIVPSSKRAPVFDLSTPNLSFGERLGNLPAAIINNSPIPALASGLHELGRLEHKAVDWATSPEGAGAVQNGGVVPTSPPFKASLPGAPIAGPGLTNPAASPSGGRPASAYRDTIAGIESAGSGDYSALGPMTGGDRAYGRYQVMGANIPSWTQAALGRTLTPEEFLADTAAQDAVFDYQFGSYLNQGSPGDAASRWFTGRPLNEAYGNRDVLGTTAEGYVNEFLRRSGQSPLPPQAEAYQTGQAPVVPNPVDAPMPTAPNFGAVNDLVNQAAPTRAATPDRFTKMLSALAQANANSDTRGPGAVSQLFANWGAGLASGSEAADVERVNAENEFQEKQRDFLLRRAAIASEQEGTLRAFKDSVGTTGFQNRSADQAASFQNEQNRYTVGEANKKMGFEAGQQNTQNLYDWQKQEIAAGKPTVLSASKDGVVIQNPDGSITNQPLGVQKLFPGYKEPEVPDAMQEVEKYSALVQTGDVQTVREEVLRDIVKDGTALQVFGPDVYNQVLEEATDAYTPTGDPETDQAAVQNAVAARLLQMSLGDDSWIPNAADMGNIGARALMGGQ